MRITCLIAPLSLLALNGCGRGDVAQTNSAGSQEGANVDLSAQLADVDKDKSDKDEITATDAATGYDSMPVASYGTAVAYQPPRWGQEASAARAAAQAQAAVEVPDNADDGLNDQPIPSATPANPNAAITPQ